MKSVSLTLFLILLWSGTCFAQGTTRIFSNAAGETLNDRLVKFDFMERLVTLEKAGRVPLDTFSQADQAYILHWNQIEGFKSTMRFKMELQKNSWARMKHEQNITPYFMEPIQIPGKKTPNHNIIFLDDYEEYNAVYMEAEGYSLTLRNQNIFPLENIVVESKIFFEQEQYLLTDSLFLSSNNDYDKSTTTNLVRALTETVPIIIPREEVVMNSECAIIVDHQVERSALVTTTASNNDSEDDDATETIDSFGELDDHARRRKGKVTGVWFRIGMKDPEGNMVWREEMSPTSLSGKVSWETEPPAHSEAM